MNITIEIDQLFTFHHTSHLLFAFNYLSIHFEDVMQMSYCLVRNSMVVGISLNEILMNSCWECCCMRDTNVLVFLFVFETNQIPIFVWVHFLSFMIFIIRIIFRNPMAVLDLELMMCKWFNSLSLKKKRISMRYPTTLNEILFFFFLVHLVRSSHVDLSDEYE